MPTETRHHDTSIPDQPDDDGRDMIPATTLWTIHDVAAFLQRSENTARAFIRTNADAPPPVHCDGRGDLWDPRAWWLMIETRQLAAEDARKRALRSSRAKAGHAKGRGTRV